MFKRIIKLSRSENNLFPVFVRSNKIMEELGEFAEALAHKMGYLPHKKMKEPLEGEAADVIICVMDTLCAAYPEKSEEEIYAMVNYQLSLKCDKWERVMAENYTSIANKE